MQHVGSADLISIYAFGEPLVSCAGVDGFSDFLAGDEVTGEERLDPLLREGEGAGGLWLCPFLRRRCPGGDLVGVRGYLREDRAGGSDESDGGGTELL